MALFMEEVLARRPHTYFRGVALLRAMRVPGAWPGAADQRLIQHVSTRAGNAKLCHRIHCRFANGSRKLESVAASVLINGLQALDTWPETDSAPAPFCLPGDFADRRRLGVPT